MVDDTTIMREFIKNVLIQQCRVSRNAIHEASDGRQAVFRYKDVKPGLVFMDITMPIMGGIAAVEQIIKFDAEAKIVMCTALSDKSQVVTSLITGALDYIVKPMSPYRIMESFEKLVEAIPTEADLIAMREAAKAAAHKEEMMRAAIVENEEEGLAYKILSDEKKNRS